MKLDKAIELSKEAEASLRSHKFIDYADAIKLGREALKRVQQFRADPDWPDLTQLPGETPPDSPQLSKDQIKKLQESPIGEK